MFYLLLLIIVYSIRELLFYVFMFVLKSGNLSEIDKKFNALAFSFGFTLFSLLGLALEDFLFFKILILFLVYGIYYFIGRNIYLNLLNPH